MTMYVVATGDRDSNGVPTFKAFEDYGSAVRFGNAVGAKEVVEMEVRQPTKEEVEKWKQEQP